MKTYINLSNIFTIMNLTDMNVYIRKLWNDRPTDGIYIYMYI